MQKRFLGIGNIKGVRGWCNGGQGVGIDSMGHHPSEFPRGVTRSLRERVAAWSEMIGRAKSY